MVEQNIIAFNGVLLDGTDLKTTNFHLLKLACPQRWRHLLFWRTTVKERVFNVEFNFSQYSVGQNNFHLSWKTHFNHHQFTGAWGIRTPPAEV